jgi:signal transduction histidine kinase
MNIFRRTFNRISEIGVHDGLPYEDSIKIRVLNQLLVVIVLGAAINCVDNIFYYKQPPFLYLLLIFSPLFSFFLHHKHKFSASYYFLFVLYPLIYLKLFFLYGEKIKIDFVFFGLAVAAPMAFDHWKGRLFILTYSIFLCLIGIGYSRIYGNILADYVPMYESFVTIISVAACIFFLIYSVQKEVRIQHEKLLKANQELRGKNEELLASINRNELKDKLFTLVAHDLRSPLISLGGLSKKVNFLIAQNRMNELSVLGDSIDAEVSNVHKLLDNLLNWAMVQGGRFCNDPETFVVDEPLLEAAEL